jgi:hypothetical protein
VIAGFGGIHFNYFEPFLESEDEMVRCSAAFQLVTLAKVNFRGGADGGCCGTPPKAP